MEQDKASALQSQTKERHTDVFRGAPTFFRARSAEASNGGNQSYANAGWHLGLHVARLIEGDADAKLTELRTALEAHDDEAVLTWFDHEFPACMQLVPRRRWEQFLQGVYAVDEDRDITNA